MNAAVIELDNYAFLQVEGAKALPFLQGQLTCNVHDARADLALPGAYCTAKGRVISSFLLWARSPEQVLLRLRADILEHTATVLARYGALSRVRIAPVGMNATGLLGSGLAPLLRDLFPNWPAEPRALAAGATGLMLRRDPVGEQFEVWSSQADTAALRESIAARLPRAGVDAWRLALVRAGTAELQHETVDQFLPQMLGYDASGAVSFRKGCYTGQEIVARTHYKGAVKRRLQRLGGSTGPCPAVGSELLHRDTGRGVGSVVESAPAGDGRFELLAVLADEAIDGTLCLARTAAGVELEVLGNCCAIL